MYLSDDDSTLSSSDELSGQRPGSSATQETRKHIPDSLESF